MKKKMILILTAAVLGCSLVACGSETSSGGNSVAETESEEEAGSESNEVEVSVDGSGNGAESDEEISAGEQTLIDNDFCTIQLTDLNVDSSGKYTLDLILENKSSDVTYMFAIDDAYVNGVANDPFFATEVAPGKKSNSSISFNSMAQYGNDKFTDIEIAFRVYDTDDWAADAVVDETVHVYPYGEENAVSYTRDAQDTDTVLLDNDYMTLIMTGYGDNSWNEFAVDLYFVNKTDSNVMLSVDDCSVNGYMVDPFFATSLKAGKSRYTSLTWSESTLEENGITDVSEIEFSLRMYDNDNWMGDDFVNETITLNF